MGLFHRRREKYNSRGCRFLMFTGLSAGILPLYPRGGSFPRFRGFIRGNSSPVPARWLFSALPRVYPRVFFPCTRAAALFRASAGLFAGNLSLYPRGGSFPRFRGFIRAFSFPVPARQHIRPGISPLAARFRLAARATDAKIRLWRIKHRRVQTAAVGLCRGVYVFVGWVKIGLGNWVGLCHRRREKYNSRGYRFLMFTGISAGNLSLYPRGGSFPRFRGFIRGFSFPVPARRLFSTLPRVYPREIFPCTRAMALFRASAGLFARFLSLYPRGDSFPRFRGFIRAISFHVPAR